ncbi:MAG: SAM-dependent methyltransferase [Anaerocolumna sp.]|nr:SAM-dependent methyltransferase [Anaerocolumna sp.]
MTEEGKVVKSKYDKYKQINRFLEFIEDILPSLDKDRELTIIDFGCGKSYLTFAMYYYLKELKNYDIKVIGLDLKKDVIEHCNLLAKQYNFQKLTFLVGDIASFEGVDKVDMVVSLHACDTATDYALYKAIKWNAEVILSVPCCQHELNGQIENDMLSPILHYGIIKERIAALTTDALRGELLEAAGYKTQILEFIDMEHTPKNLLLRGVRKVKGKTVNNKEGILLSDEKMPSYEKIREFLNVEPTLYQLLVKPQSSSSN